MLNVNDNPESGIAELLILSLLQKEDLHAEQIADIFAEKSGGKYRAPEDLYSILCGLISNGYISTYTAPLKKNIGIYYYRIEDKGREYYQKILKDYQAETKAIHDILDIDYDFEGNVIRTAIIGSRNVHVDDEDIKKYLPKGTTEIVSGGAKGIDTCARNYAQRNGISLVEILPEYEKYGRSAPLRRNIQIVERADYVLAFWDGKSRGTAFVINECRRKSVPFRIIKK